MYYTIFFAALLLQVSLISSMHIKDHNDNEQPFSREEKWEITQQQENEFQQFIANPFVNGCYQDHLEDLINFKKRVRKDLIQREKKYKRAFKKMLPVNDTDWETIKKVTTIINSFENENKHLPLTEKPTVTVSAEMQQFLEKQLKKNGIHPGRFNLYSNPQELSCAKPLISVVYDPDSSTFLIDNETPIKLGDIVIPEPFMNYFFKPCARPIALYLVKKLLCDDGILDITSRWLTNNNLSVKNYLSHKAWKKSSAMIIEKTLVLNALKNHEYASAMLQAAFLSLHSKNDTKTYTLLSQIECHWRKYAWLQERLQKMPYTPAYRNKQGEFAVIDQMKLNFEKQLQHQSKIAIKKQLDECDHIVKMHNQNTVTAIRKKFCIHNHLWNQIQASWQLVEKAFSDRLQTPYPNVVHDLPEPILSLLKKYLENAGLNPNNISLRSSNNDNQLAFVQMSIPCNYNTINNRLSVIINNQESPAEIHISRLIHNSSLIHENLKSAILQAPIQRLMHNDIPITLLGSVNQILPHPNKSTNKM